MNEYYKEKNWRNKNGMSILKSWKISCRNNWFKEENKQKDRTIRANGFVVKHPLDMTEEEKRNSPRFKLFPPEPKNYKE